MGGEGRVLPAGAYGVAAQVVVPLRREAAWTLFTKGIAGWWPAGFATRADAVMALEAEPGGRLGEKWPRGGGLTWYTVVGVEPEAWMLLAGDLTVAYGGPARSHVELLFDDAEGGGTRLRLTDTLFAGASPALQASMEAGWKALLDAFAAGAAAAAKGPPPRKPKKSRRNRAPRAADSPPLVEPPSGPAENAPLA